MKNKTCLLFPMDRLICLLDFMFEARDKNLDHGSEIHRSGPVSRSFAPRLTIIIWLMSLGCLYCACDRAALWRFL